MQADAEQARRLLVPGTRVEERFARSGKTLTRWVRDTSMGFPRPIIIRGRRYFYEDEIDKWEATQASGEAA